MNFIKQLRLRNPLLYWFGWLMLLGGITCAILTKVDNTIILGYQCVDKTNEVLCINLDLLLDDGVVIDLFETTKKGKII